MAKDDSYMMKKNDSKCNYNEQQGKLRKQAKADAEKMAADSKANKKKKK